MYLTASQHAQPNAINPNFASVSIFGEVETYADGEIYYEPTVFYQGCRSYDNSIASSADCYAAFSGDEYSGGDVDYNGETCSQKSYEWDYSDWNVDDKCEDDSWALNEYAPKCCSDGISVCASEGSSTPIGESSY